MIDVQIADELVKKHAVKLSVEVAPLELLEGRTLAEEIKATREQPPFDRVAMDGIAIRFEHLKNKQFPLEGIQKAGSSALKLSNAEGAIEAMTGAVLPNGCDTVIPYERISIKEGIAFLHDDVEVKNKQNIHFQGSDYAEGETLLQSGVKLTSAAIAIIAGQGKAGALVTKFPKIAVISTGDELIEPGLDCEAWQIWRSNPFGIKSELMALGIYKEEIDLYHLPDKRDEIFENLKKLFDEYEVLVLSGGVSMGKYDFVHSIMGDLGVEKIFHKIKQKPGKPMFFGTGPKGQSVFGLPGNPVSALTCLRRYVVPSLETALGLTIKPLNVVLGENLKFKKEFSLFKAVSITNDSEGRLIATPLDSNGSGDFASLALSHGFIELPAKESEYPAGNTYPFYPWKGALS